MKWTLAYPVADEDMQQRCRLHFESLSKDDNVRGVHFESPTDMPNIRVLHVEFKPGCSQPKAPSLRHLNVMFPVRSEPWAFAPTGPPLIDERAHAEQISDATAAMRYAHTAIIARAAETQHLAMLTTEAQFISPVYPISAEYSANAHWRLGIPPWCLEGSWLQEIESGIIYQVIHIVPVPTPGIATLNYHLKPWRRYEMVVVRSTRVMQDFVATSKPEDPEVWYRRLLGEDPINQ